MGNSTCMLAASSCSACILAAPPPPQSLLSCRCCWSPSEIPLGSTSTLTLHVKSSLIVPITASSIQVVSSDKSLTRNLVTVPTDGHEVKRGDPLLLPAGGTVTLNIEFIPQSEGEVSLQQVSIVLGREPCAIYLSLPLLTLSVENEIIEQPRLIVTPPQPEMTISLNHVGPVLVQVRPRVGALPVGVCARHMDV